MNQTEGGLLTDLLKQVSRSFYLTLWVLPAPVRSQIGLAYLLARATDTVADTDVIPVAQRLQALAELQQAILTAEAEHSGLSQSFRSLAGHQALPAEKVLLERLPEALTLLRGQPEEDRRLIREVLKTITSGQELDLQRFGAASGERILALQTDGELDDYTYRVAGCVGEFWTKICRTHLFAKAALDGVWLSSQGIRFGKGLQLVNILRDLPKDLRQGRCYLPAPQLAAHSLRPSDLLHASAMPRFRHCYDEYLALAEAHLVAGWAYTQALPRRQVRVRLACAWPLLIGIKTIGKLRVGNVLDDQQRIKVSRAEVRGLLLRSVLYYPFPELWHSLFDRTRKG